MPWTTTFKAMRVAAAIAAGGSDNVSVVVVRATAPAGQDPMH